MRRTMLWTNCFNAMTSMVRRSGSKSASLAPPLLYQHIIVWFETLSLEKHVGTVATLSPAVGSGTLCKDEFDTFMRVASGDPGDAATPPPGASADLSTVVEGSQVLAFYASDELWCVLPAFPAQPIQFCIESKCLTSSTLDS